MPQVAGSAITYLLNVELTRGLVDLSSDMVSDGVVAGYSHGSLNRPVANHKLHHLCWSFDNCLWDLATMHSTTCRRFTRVYHLHGVSLWEHTVRLKAFPHSKLHQMSGLLSIPTIFGGFIESISIATILYGVTAAQAYVYMLNCEYNFKWIKVIASLIVLIETPYTIHCSSYAHIVLLLSTSNHKFT
ncbi:unnamed protein product [Somion occarium]|uniref:Uncharacterized protein n=1 Tax=Somion occarium TaxID=3059160 RepID=A0ABP1E0K7_9APHY